MTEDNKKVLKEFGKAVLIAILMGIVIISNAAVWNAVALGAIGSFYSWVSVINFLLEGFGIYKVGTMLFPKSHSDEESK